MHRPNKAPKTDGYAPGLGLFARRNKALVVAIASAFGILVTGVVVTTSLWVQSKASQARAEEEAESIRVKARDDAHSEKARALSEARSQVGDISVDLAGKIVGDSLDADAHQDLIDRYLEDLERL